MRFQYSLQVVHIFSISRNDVGVEEKKMRNLVVGLFREAKTNYNTKMNQILYDPSIPSKKWWGIVKFICYSAIPAICKREVFISFQKKIVNALNDFLMSQAMSVPNNDSAEIPFLTRESLGSLSFIAADKPLLRLFLSSFNISKASGCEA